MSALFELAIFLACAGDRAAPPADALPTGDPPAGPVASGVTARVHDAIGSIVVVEWRQGQPGTAWIEFDVDGEARSTPAEEVTLGDQDQFLLGIPYDEEVRFRLVEEGTFGSWESKEQTIRTGEVPAEILVPESVTGDSSRWEPSGNYLLLSINEHGGGWVGGTYWMFVIDRQGRVVWAQETPNRHWTIYARPSTDGTDILWDEATFWADYDGGAGSTVHRMKIDGTVTETIATPGLHHAFTDLPDGSIAWGAAAGFDESLEILSPDGVQSTVWVCGDFHDSIGARTQCQSNSLWWNEPTDSFLYSFYTSNSIIEIDRTTGDTLRWFGNLPGSWVFDPEDSQFWWQHGVSYTDAGTLLVSTEAGDETAVREYALDESEAALHQVWSFGIGEGIHGDTNGEAHRLANGNTLHNLGSAARVREVAPEGEVVWDVTWQRTHLLGRCELIEDLYAFAP